MSRGNINCATTPTLEKRYKGDRKNISINCEYCCKESIFLINILKIKSGEDSLKYLKEEKLSGICNKREVLLTLTVFRVMEFMWTF